MAKATIGRRIVSGMASAAFHAACLASLVLLPIGASIPNRGADVRTVAIVQIVKPRESPADILAESLRIDSSTAPRPLRIPNFAVDVSRIRARQDALFPLLTQGLPVLDDVRTAEADTNDALTWVDPSVAPRSRTGLPPLRLSDAALDRTVDEAWSRRDRWQNFVEIAALITEHDPDTGRSAELVRTHLDRNLLQPYSDTTTRDPRFWVMLNMAADQEPMIGFVSAFLREHPSTRVSTELLFLLDEYAQASRDALMMLVSTSPEHQLVMTRESDPAAYELAVTIRNHYAGWLRERGLDGREDIWRQYDDIRLRILWTIVESTPDGFGAADARYLIGRIHWDQGETDEAISVWRELGVDERDMYEPFYSRIVPEVRAPSGGSAARINAVLGAEYGQWLRSSEARLREFGFASDSF